LVRGSSCGLRLKATARGLAGRSRLRYPGGLESLAVPVAARPACVAHLVVSSDFRFEMPSGAAGCRRAHEAHMNAMSTHCVSFHLVRSLRSPIYPHGVIPRPFSPAEVGNPGPRRFQRPSPDTAQRAPSLVARACRRPRANHPEPRPRSGRSRARSSGESGHCVLGLEAGQGGLPAIREELTPHALRYTCIAFRRTVVAVTEASRRQDAPSGAPAKAEHRACAERDVSSISLPHQRQATATRCLPYLCVGRATPSACARSSATYRDAR
jgi:hypothetical protein